MFCVIAGLALAPRNQYQGLAALYKRCSTIERNTTKKNAKIKSVPCPLALCKKPGIVMGVCSLRAYYQLR
jgi:hypothetical protein